MSDIELKPCPFCGGEGLLKESKIMAWVVICSNGIKCPVQPVAHSNLRMDARTRWNKRAKPRLVKVTPEPRYDEVFFDRILNNLERWRKGNTP